MRYLRAPRLTAAAAAVIAAATFGMLLASQPSRAGGDTVYALDGPNLISFNSASPGTADNTVAITGLQAAEAILAIDFRPANRALYGLGSTSRLYVIGTATGVATQVGSGTFTTPLVGTYFGFDFNPVADRIRVVSNTGQNMRLNPATAEANLDTDLSYDSSDPHAGMMPTVVALGHANNFAGAGVTTAFGIDSGFDTAVRLGGANGAPPSTNSGALFTMTSLGVDTTGAAGLDIAGASSGYALLTVGGVPQLYAVSAITGLVTELGSIGALFAISDIAVPIPEATPTPTPTATPTPTPTATPTPTPTATPTPTPTATPTPTPTPTTTPTPTPGTGTPTATPTTTPSPTPTGTPEGRLWGDVDCDEDIDSVDALKLLRHVAGLPVVQNEPCTDIGEVFASFWGDVDCGGDVSSVDALKILRYVASLSVSQTEPCPDIGTQD